ncbi:thiamine-phosphate kinase [Nitratifractor sp.]
MDKEAYLISRFDSRFIGDDGAVIGEWVYSADAFCEGTHFLREWMSPRQIGRKAMLVNLSDAVAMNADPAYALLTLSIPRQMEEEEIAELAKSLQECAAEYGCEIVGGDTVGGEKLHLSITLVSRSEAPLLRRGIRPGDLLAYTGELGGVKRDLDALFAGERISQDSRFFEPKLRRDFIRKVRPWLRAGMDISDGLYCDVNKLLDLNELGMETLIEIPAAVGMSGEEYEMLVAFAPDERDKIETLAKKMGVPLTVFARVEKNDFRYPCGSHHF